MADVSPTPDPTPPAKPWDQSFTEEPGLVLEADLPSDGRDEIGEAMIRNLPQRPELSEPSGMPDSAPTQP
ncbi:MAG: hypothetical protein ABIQ90_15060 [Polaromonas sp.]